MDDLNTERAELIRRQFVVAWLLATVILLAFTSFAEDWPTYRADNSRSGVTEGNLRIPLRRVWTYVPRHAPSPAWWTMIYRYERKDKKKKKLEASRSREIYDHAFHVAVADGLVYFGSSTDDKVYCLDAETGKETWTFFTEGPVRLAPSVANGRVYVGSDDGWVYCLDAKNGKFVWKKPAMEKEYRVPGNSRIISLWPVRSSVHVLDDGDVVFGAGLLPSQGVHLVRLDGKSGQERGRSKLNFSSQGYCTIRDGKLHVATGRTGPKGITSDAYKAQRRGAGRVGFSPPKDFPHCPIRAGSVHFAGGTNKVAAFGKGGKALWQANVEGQALGLAVAGGRLFVSTSKGAIHAFAPAGGGRPTRTPRRAAARPSPRPRRTATSAASAIAAQIGPAKGYCLDLGCGDGQLALELAKLTQLHIIGLEDDAKKVDAARKMLDEAGMYGTRVVVHHGALNDMTYGPYLFNVIVSNRIIETGRMPRNREEIRTLLRPCGGIAVLGHQKPYSITINSSEAAKWRAKDGSFKAEVVKKAGTWLVVRRGALPGAGDWTHQYADAGNSSYSGDALVGPKLRLQWFGPPEARFMYDRHSRTPAPLYSNGRLYVRGRERVFGVDAYNGTILWDREIDGLRARVNVPRDSGHVAADSESFYVAVGRECRRLDGQTGELSRTYRMPVRGTYDWGYLALDDTMLFGSAIKQGVFFSGGDGPWYDRPGSSSQKVLSYHLFGLDRKTGRSRWAHRGLIIGSSIAAGDGHIYFVECRSSAAVQAASRQGRLGDDSASWKGLFLVSLDVGTGKKRWEKPVEFVLGKIVFYLSYARGTLVVVSSPHTGYGIYGFDAATGSKLWEQTAKYRKRNSDNHGGHMQHPVIRGDSLVQDPYDYDLRTGKKGQLLLDRQGHSCGQLSASADYLFGRGGNPRLYFPKDSRRSVAICRINRPGCMINILPAGGLVLIPEASSGCSCDYSIQTSMAFRPLE